MKKTYKNHTVSEIINLLAIVQSKLSQRKEDCKKMVEIAFTVSGMFGKVEITSEAYPCYNVNDIPYADVYLTMLDIKESLNKMGIAVLFKVE